MSAEVSGVAFRDDVWLSTHRLDANTIYDYFYASPFYDRESLNEKGRRGIQITDDFEGVEFRLVFRSPGTGPMDPEVNSNGVFIIQKCIRQKSKPPQNRQVYYVISGTIYEAPPLADVIRRRLSDVLTSLESCYDSIRSMCNFDMSVGYTWKLPKKKRPRPVPLEGGGGDGSTSACAGGAGEDQRGERRNWEGQQKPKLRCVVAPPPSDRSAAGALEGENAYLMSTMAAYRDRWDKFRTG